MAAKERRCGSSCAQSKLKFAWGCAVEIQHYYEQRGGTTSTWGLLYENAFKRIFIVQFADTALASDFGDVEPCRIEVLHRIQCVGGTRVVCPRAARLFLAFLGHLPTLLCLAAKLAALEQKAMGAGEDVLVLFPWLGARSTGSRLPVLGARRDTMQ